jgi:hypothetical protein
VGTVGLCEAQSGFRPRSPTLNHTIGNGVAEAGATNPTRSVAAGGGKKDLASDHLFAYESRAAISE